MKKNIVIGFLIIVCILSLTFGYYQKARADKNEAQLLKEKLMEVEFQKKSEDIVKSLRIMKNDSSINTKDVDKKTKK